MSTRQYHTDTVIKKFCVGRPYQNPCVNYNGFTKEGREYIEVLSDYILSCNGKFDLKEYQCRKSFVLHEKIGYRPNTRSEKGLCRYWFFNGFEQTIKNELGTPIEYELNLYGKRVNIDLISFENGIVHLIEVKGKVEKSCDSYSSQETLLRCALEIFTYYKTLEKNIDAFVSQLFEKLKIDSKDINIQLDILVPENNFYKKQANESLYPSLNKLLKKWRIAVHFYDDSLRIYD